VTSRDEGAPREGRTRGAAGGIVPIVTTNRHEPFSVFKNIDFERSYDTAISNHFGPINKRLEVLILDTGLRYFLALNGRN
jgi:hypothetical protein